MKSKSRKPFYAGITLTFYGLVGLFFEILNTSYSKLAEIVWTILNPIFVFTVGLTKLVLLSLYADFSTVQTSAATLTYWAFPLLMIALGLFLVVKE